MNPFRNGAAGVVSSAKLFRPEDFAELTTPSAALSVAPQLLVDAAATPPLRGGEYSTFNISSIHSHFHRPRLQCWFRYCRGGLWRLWPPNPYYA